MVVIKEAIPELRKLYGESFISEVETFSEVIGYSTEKDDSEFRVEFNPDRPDLFSFNLLKNSMDVYYGNKQWKPISIKKGGSSFLVDDNVKSLRRFAIGFQCTGPRIGSHFRELIDYQEKIHLSIGKDRTKVSIGIHDQKNLRFPVTYSARKSDEVKFTTYDGTITGTAKEIIKTHPKGLEYGHLIPSNTLVPIIEDADHRVLSMPPVINGDVTTVTENTEIFFIDMTGTDLKALKEAFFLLSYYFYGLGYEITAANLDDIAKELKSDGRTITISLKEIEKILGQHLSAKECTTLLQHMGYQADIFNTDIKVKIPGNRGDVMGPVDVIEDVAKAHGYGNLILNKPNLDIIGLEAVGNQMAANIRTIMLGLGYQEVMTYVVSSQDHYANARYGGGVHIRNPKSLDFSMVRDRLYLGILDLLRLNKRRNLPQLLFEIGEVISDTKQSTNLCVARINSKSAFSDIKQVLDALMTRLSFENYVINSADHENFIPGRTGEIVVQGKTIGYLGEIHPDTLEQYELKNPVAIMELNLSTVSRLLH